MKSNNFNKMTLSVVATMTITMLMLFSGHSNLLQLHGASAQEHEPMMTMPSGSPDMMSMNENYNTKSYSMYNDEENITSSISVFRPLIDAFKSYIQVDITDAIATAQQSVGNNSTTLVAYIHPEGQFIVYNVFVVDANGTFYRVMVDPGNGQVLDSQQISFMKMMKMFHGGAGKMMHGGSGGMMGHSGSGGMMGHSGSGGMNK